MQSKFHKIFTVVTTAVMLLSSIAVFPAFGGSAENVMTADDITQNMTIGWNIGNSLDATGYGSSQETSWGNPTVTQELIDAVKAKGLTPFEFRLPGIRMLRQQRTKTASLFTQSVSSGCSALRKLWTTHTSRICMSF